MKIKQFNLAMFNDEEYYYLDGECPEVMSFIRVCGYAEAILESNKDDLGLPEKWNKQSSVTTVTLAEEVIEWFGESLFLIKK